VKSFRFLSLSIVLLSCAAVAQNTPAVRTDLYHVHVAAAAPGKAAQLGDYLKTPDATSPMPGHVLVLRHQDGAEWDYIVIAHLGTKTTVAAAGTPTPANVRDLYAWHGDTFVNGPAWPEFVRAMGLGDQAAKSANAVYVASFYRALPGHRDQLEQRLSAAPGGDVAGSVLLQHIEGGPWTFLEVTRYDSWQSFAANESSSVAQTAKGSGPWFALRENISTHTDTLTNRIAP
jgi:hypothetical protein